MTPACMVGMPKSPRSVASTAAAAPFGERRKPRFCVAAASGRDEQHPPSMAAVPASLRTIQAKRKKMSAARGVPRATSAGLLGLVASCLSTAVEMEMERMMRAREEAEASARKAEPVANAAEDAEEADDVPMLVGLDMEKELWARIGIQQGDMPPLRVDEDEQDATNVARAELRKAAYERIIATSEANSLILSNYAQLLYEFDKDLDRNIPAYLRCPVAMMAWAEDYFKRSVAIQPADGEAMRRYAMFLWQSRGDLVGAEDMFTGAIDEEPDSSHHRSSYAWFLWMNGSVETCVIDSAGSNNDPE